MSIMRVLIAALFITALSSAAFANQDEDKGEDKTQGTVAEPDCEYTSAGEHP
jgi:type 1 fimbria pilin